jgi:hypothetical protein
MKSPHPLLSSSFGIAGRILTSSRHLLMLIDRMLQVSPSEPNDLSFLETPTMRIDRELKRTYV